MHNILYYSNVFVIYLFISIKGHSVSKRDGASDHADRSRSCISMAPVNLQELIKAKINNAYSQSILMKTSAAYQTDINSLMAHRTLSSTDSKSDSSLGNKDLDSITSRSPSLKLKSPKIDIGRDVLLKQLEKKIRVQATHHISEIDQSPPLTDHDQDKSVLLQSQQDINVQPVQEMNTIPFALDTIEETTQESQDMIPPENQQQEDVDEAKQVNNEKSNQDNQSNPGITIIVQRRISVDVNNTQDGNVQRSLLANFNAVQESLGISRQDRRSAHGDTLSTRKYRTVAVITPNDDNEEELQQSSEEEDNENQNSKDQHDCINQVIDPHQHLDIRTKQQDHIINENFCSAISSKNDHGSNWNHKQDDKVNENLCNAISSNNAHENNSNHKQDDKVHQVQNGSDAVIMNESNHLNNNLNFNDGEFHNHHHRNNNDTSKNEQSNPSNIKQEIDSNQTSHLAKVNDSKNDGNGSTDRNLNATVNPKTIINSAICPHLNNNFESKDHHHNSETVEKCYDENDSSNNLNSNAKYQHNINNWNGPENTSEYFSDNINQSNNNNTNGNCNSNSNSNSKDSRGETLPSSNNSNNNENKN